MPDTRGIGVILREADLITEAQLAEALELQKVHHERLASVLVRQRVLTEKFAVTYLGRKIGVPGVDLSRIELELFVFELLPLDVCRRHMVLPIRVEGNRLHLAMADPTNGKVLTEIEFKLDAKIVPMVALESSLKHAHEEVGQALKAKLKRITLGAQAPAAPAPAAVVPAPVPPPPPTPPAATVPPVPKPAAERPELPQRIPLAAATDRETIFTTLAGGFLSAEPPAALRVSPSKELPTVEAMETILVIDDSEVARKLIEGLLRKPGYHVMTSETGRDGLARMRDALPDLVILDGMLPGVHGFEICRYIKTSERFRHIPVMMLSAVHTGWRIAGDVKEKYGADDYLTKPFEPTDFLRRVQALLKRKSAAPPHSEAAIREHLRNGVAALKEERLDEAIGAFERGLSVDQFHDMLHYYLAMALEKKGRVFDAIDHYEKAVQVNPKFFDAITALANLYQRQEFWRKAREMWEVAMDATKDDSIRARIKEHLQSLL